MHHARDTEGAPARPSIRFAAAVALAIGGSCVLDDDGNVSDASPICEPSGCGARDCTDDCGEYQEACCQGTAPDAGIACEPTGCGPDDCTDDCGAYDEACCDPLLPRARMKLALAAGAAK